MSSGGPCLLVTRGQVDGTDLPLEEGGTVSPWAQVVTTADHLLSHLPHHPPQEAANQRKMIPGVEERCYCLCYFKWRRKKSQGVFLFFPKGTIQQHKRNKMFASASLECPYHTLICRKV